MTHLSEDTRKSVVEKDLARKGQGLAKIASLHNIGYSTPQRWIFKYKHGMKISKNSNKSLENTQCTGPKQFQHLLMTAALDETTLGAYC